jgi:hypothetical protein
MTLTTAAACFIGRALRHSLTWQPRRDNGASIWMQFRSDLTVIFLDDLTPVFTSAKDINIHAVKALR